MKQTNSAWHDKQMFSSNSIIWMECPCFFQVQVDLLNKKVSLLEKAEDWKTPNSQDVHAFL